MTPGAPTSSSRVFAVLGDPVAHSLSPVIQNAALEAAGQDGVYVALRATDVTFEGLVRGLAAAGGGGNVTLPHKARLLALADRALPDALRTGAANTFWADESGLVVDNTDVVGCRRALLDLDPSGLDGAHALVLGAGGAARAAVAALLDAGVARVAVHNRTHDRAARLVAESGDPRVVTVEALDGDAGRADLMVNATSLGLRPDDPLPCSPDVLDATGARLALDLVYATRAQGTPWVEAARARGLEAADGRGMLLHQGTRAFERWWRHDAPLEAMRAALERAAPGRAVG